MEEDPLVETTEKISSLLEVSCKIPLSKSRLFSRTERARLSDLLVKWSSLLVRKSRYRSTWKGRSPWSLCPEEEWEGIPLGLLPGSSKVPKLVREGSNSPNEHTSGLIGDPVRVPSITPQQIDMMSRQLVELLES